VVDLPVHTGLMRLERRLYQVGDVELPRPVTLAEALIFVACFVPLALLGRAIGLGLNPYWAWLYLVLPTLAAWAGTSHVADRKRPQEWARSQLRYLLAEPRLLARLRPVREPAEARLRVRVWQPSPPAHTRWDAMESLRNFRLEVDRRPDRWTAPRLGSSSPRPARGRVAGRWNGGVR
jgi:TcpE family